MNYTLNLGHELVIDNFAGGGGASTGIEAAIGRAIDAAINHDPEALAMHEANHPDTKHYCESVWDIDPIEITGNQPVGLVWLSPDCKHFSKAKGGTPVNKRIRGLAWVTLRWAAKCKPRVIMLENVEEFKTWGPLIERDGKMYPDPNKKGVTFNSFVRQLSGHGYKVETKELRACDYGAPTIRKRFFLIARRDGLPIVWPEPTHGDPKSAAVKSGKLQPWRTAAECIDWSIPCPSIFERKKPLAESTLKRIAKGIQRFVIDAQEPFIVQYYSAKRDGDDRTADLNKPLPTQTTENRFALVSAFLTTYYGGKVGREMTQPAGTVTSIDHHGLIIASMTKFNTGAVGYSPDEPTHTITAGGIQKRPGTAITQGIVTANLVHMGHGEGGGTTKRRSHGIRDIALPLNTVTASGSPAGIVTSHLAILRNNSSAAPVNAPINTITSSGAHHAEVRAFLVEYYGNNKDGADITKPLHTITTHDRFGIVTIHGVDYQIVDIGLRMLTPKELFTAQGFPADYQFEMVAHGKKLSKTAQVRMVGNSVCPPLAEALVRANFAHEQRLLKTA